jgi:hypothetical protein
MTKLLFLYITAETQAHFIMISSLRHNYTFITLIMPMTLPAREREKKKQNPTEASGLGGCNSTSLGNGF